MKENRMETIIDFTLRAGATTSAVLLAIGLLLTFFPLYGTAPGGAFIVTGIFVLFATPVARVILSIFLFAAERNRLYVLITTIVLANIIVAIFVVPFILHLWAP